MVSLWCLCLSEKLMIVLNCLNWLLNYFQFSLRKKAHALSEWWNFSLGCSLFRKRINNHVYEMLLMLPVYLYRPTNHS